MPLYFFSMYPAFDCESGTAGWF